MPQQPQDAGVTVEGVAAIYAAVLSTITAGVGLFRTFRRRKIHVRFSYGWNEERGRPAKLIVRVHNDSPLATIHLLQVGWTSTERDGDWWEPSGSSVAVEAGSTYTHEFEVGTPPARVRASVILGDRSTREAEQDFEVPHYGISTSGDTMQVRPHG